MKWRRRRRIDPDRDFLTLVPRRGVPAEVSPSTGRTILLVPRYRDPLFGRLLQPRLPLHKRHIRVTLDERGSVLWQAMDGERDVRALCAILAERRPDDAEQLAERVSMYLYRMIEQGFVEVSSDDA